MDKEELDDEKEISIEIITDTNKEEENKSSQEGQSLRGKPGWMAEIRQWIDKISQQKLKKKAEGEDSESSELFDNPDSESEVNAEPDSDWKLEIQCRYWWWIL